MSRIQTTFPVACALAVLYVFSIGSFGQIVVAQSDYVPARKTGRIAKRLLIQDPITGEVPKDEEVENSSEDESPQRLDFEEEDKKDDLDFDDDLGFDDEQDRKPERPAFGPWPRKGLRGISLDIREKSTNVPEDRSPQLLNSSNAHWTQFQPTPKVFAWAAPDIHYQPLYFEDVTLERYGQAVPGDYHQTLISTYHFFKSSVLLPYQMHQDRPGSCVSPLGFCRPGNKVPYTFEKHFWGLRRQ